MKEIKRRVESTKSEKIKRIRKEEYNEKDRQVNLSVREDKRQWTQKS